MDSVQLTIVAKDGELRFKVHPKPRAKRTAIVGIREHDGALEVALAAPPVDGAANAELTLALARVLGVTKAAVRIVHGESSRAKLVAVRGLDESELRGRLTASAKPARRSR
ncbi:MAG TPA: DUF167 domain-containing protein [Polyangiaceae bacterium]|nr:DUF167 domain-containing protein [Polyangiaceae bacterium]